jgi:NAD(P)-dependent dehydrogenase (short-subunit alcohol dehydrogenase family)
LVGFVSVAPHQQTALCPTIATVDISGKVTVVTGGANGIGRAMARRFAAEGARGVLVADLDGVGAGAVAEEIRAAGGAALGVTCDVTDEAAVVAAIDSAEVSFGPVELYCANAGVGVGAEPDTPDELWDLAFGVNVRAHVSAARRLLPGWLERGGGYFLSTASAAGLLTQIGSAPYAVTKHAAVAFAEWLAVTYGDRGVRVSCLCPMGVNTGLLGAGGADGGVAAAAAAAVRASGAVLEPADVADVVVRGLAEERFLILTHPEVLTFWRRKTADYDRWLAGMRRLQARLLDAGGQ